MLREELEQFVAIAAVGATVPSGPSASPSYNVALVVVGLILVLIGVLPHAT